MGKLYYAKVAEAHIAQARTYELTAEAFELVHDAEHVVLYRGFAQDYRLMAAQMHALAAETAEA